MNTLTIGGTAAGKTYSLGQRERKAREDGATVWSYATGGNCWHPHFEYAEWSVSDDHLTEMADRALEVAIRRASSTLSGHVPVRILLDDPDPDFYSGDTGQIMKELAKRGPTVGVEIHSTVSPGNLRSMPGDLRAQFYEVDLRETRANPSQGTGAEPEFETGTTSRITVTGETMGEAFTALGARIFAVESSTGYEVEVTGVNVDHSGLRLTAFYDLFEPSQYAPGVIV